MVDAVKRMQHVSSSSISLLFHTKFLCSPINFRRKYAHSTEERKILKEWHTESPKIFPIFTRKKKTISRRSPGFEFSLPEPAEAFLFAWPRQLPQRLAHNFHHPSLSHPLGLLVKTKEPILLLSRLPLSLGQTRVAAHWHRRIAQQTSSPASLISAKLRPSSLSFDQAPVAAEHSNVPHSPFLSTANSSSL